MSVKLDAAIVSTGTKFRVYPQPKFLPSFSVPETIRVSLPPNQISAGPADNRMFVIDAINKTPYDVGEGPPYNGPANPPVAAGPNGHFDHLQAGTRAFSAAHMYAVVRRVLDIWQDYFGDIIPWHFAPTFARMLLIPRVRWNNAQSGFGFLEFGFASLPSGAIDQSSPYCENFDVLAHEVGHSIAFSQVGIPNRTTNTEEYGGFQESAGDLVAILASLHFPSVINHLLDNTHGNLFTANELERVGELSTSDQIRSAFNDLRMSDIIPRGNPPRREPHELSEPLTGATFDILVEVFQKELVSRGLITQDLADRSFHDGNTLQDNEAIQQEFDAAYVDPKKSAFANALEAARDYLGQLIAKTWSTLSPHFLSYAGIAQKMLAADHALTGGMHQETIRSSFVWRQISGLTNLIAATPHRYV